MIAQIADLNGIAMVEVVLLQLELFLLVYEETIDSRAHKRLARSDAVFLAGHCEASSNFLVVDIVAQVHHH